MTEICGVCEALLKKPREIETGLCFSCEVETHACSTGDCPHEMAGECQLSLDDLKRDQSEGEK